MFDDNAKGWQEKLEEYVPGRGVRVGANAMFAGYMCVR